jgi:hypothetical protein
LFLTNNTLSGNLDDIFDSFNQTKLTNIDLVNNRLHGSLPSSIFGLSSLEKFAISNNCIKGSLLFINYYQFLLLLQLLLY